MNLNETTKLKAAFFDIDGTLTSERTWKGFVDYFKKHDERRVTYLMFIVCHYSLYALHRIGLVSALDFRGIWAANMAWFVRNERPEATKPLWDWSVTYLKPYLRKDILAILENHQENGDLIILVSSALSPMVARFAQELGSTHAIGTALEVKNGHYTGRSLKPVCIDINKAGLAKDYLQNNGLNIDFSSSYAYGDSITDLPLLEMTGNPVAVYPDEALKAEAVKRGWRIFPECKED